MSVHKIAQSMFMYQKRLETVSTDAWNIEKNAFQYCNNLRTVDLTSNYPVKISDFAFNGCAKLTHFIVRSSSVSTLSSTNVLNNTGFNIENAGIYVPSGLLDSYKSATNWISFARSIYPIDDYPRQNFDTIQDSWSTILSNTQYSTAYSIKDTKTMELTDGTKIKMDLAAIDTDVKSDNSGTAKMTWICQLGLLSHRMNPMEVDSTGWDKSEMRSWLISDILPKIPDEVRSHLVSVKKSYRTAKNETLWSDDYIWLPSCREVCATNTSYIESDGVSYSDRFNSRNDRLKYQTSGERSGWWFRTAVSSKYFMLAKFDGDIGPSGHDYTNGVAFGICTS